MWARNTTIGQRLTVGFGTIILLVLIMTGITQYGEQRQSESLGRLTELVMTAVDSAKDVKAAYLRASGAVRSFIYTGDEAWLVEYQESMAQAQNALSRVDRTNTTPDEIALFSEVQSLSTQWGLAAERGIALRQQGKLEESAQTITQTMKPTRDRLLEKTDAFIDLQYQHRNDASSQANEVQATANGISALLTLFVIIFGSLAAFVTSRSVTQPVRTLVRASQSLAEGDHEPAIRLAAAVDGFQANEVIRDEVRALSSTFGTMAQRLLDREERLQAKARLSAVLASSVQAKQAAHDAMVEIARHLDCEFGAVYALDSDVNTLKPIATYSLDAALENVRVGDGLVGEAAASMNRVLVRNIPSVTPFSVRFGFDQVPPRTVVAQPMVMEGQVIGVMLLGSLRDISDEALTFLGVAAQQLGLSLDNAFAQQRVRTLADELQVKNEILEEQNEELQAQAEELQSQAEEIQSQNEELQHQNEEIQSQNEELHVQSEEILSQTEALALHNSELARQSQRLSLLQNISARLSTSLAPQEVLEEVVSGASNLLKSSKSGVFLLDESTYSLVCAASVGLDETAETNRRLVVENSLAGRAMAEGRTVFLEDMTTATDVFVPIISDGLGVGSFIVTPLVADGKTLGVVEIYFTNPRSFSEDEVELLTVLGSAAAVAVRNARLFSAVEQQMQLLDSVLAHVPEAVQVTDARGQLVIANSAALEVFGKSRPELLQAAASDSGDPLENLPLPEPWWPTVKAMRGEMVLAQELPFRNPENGKEGYAQVSAVPIFNSAGHLDSVVTVAANISRLKEIELLKDEFLSVASHELKSPLTSLKGFAQLLQERIEPDSIFEEFRMPLQTIDGQVNKVVVLVNRLLDMSRAQMGRLDLKVEHTDLGELMRRQIQQSQVRKGNHQLIADIDEGIAGNWDAGYIDQVASNLLDNAFRYSPNGGAISVSLKRAGETACLTVADQGIGISAEAIPNLFKRYYRSDAAKKVSAEGMGIGLYITHAIVEAHDGRIWVDSEPGKGSSFHVELPINHSRLKDSVDGKSDSQKQQGGNVYAW